MIFVAARSDPETVELAYSAGADDYVAKPSLGAEFVTRISSRLERVRQFRADAETDGLTGLSNRAHFDHFMAAQFALAQRERAMLSLLLMDVDKFKSINDEFGHLIGDHVLVAAAAVLAGQARPYDLPARFGGEEFMVILPENTLVDAMSYAQRVRCAIGELKVPGMARQITMSLGISTWEHGDTAAGLIGRADAALYQAKSRGRNRVVAQAGDGLAALESEVPAAHTQDSLAHFI